MAESVFLNLNELEKSAEALGPYLTNPPGNLLKLFVMIGKRMGVLGA